MSSPRSTGPTGSGTYHSFSSLLSCCLPLTIADSLSDQMLLNIAGTLLSGPVQQLSPWLGMLFPPSLLAFTQMPCPCSEAFPDLLTLSPLHLGSCTSQHLTQPARSGGLSCFTLQSILLKNWLTLTLFTNIECLRARYCAKCFAYISYLFKNLISR